MAHVWFIDVQRRHDRRTGTTVGAVNLVQLPSRETLASATTAAAAASAAATDVGGNGRQSDSKTY